VLRNCRAAFPGDHATFHMDLEAILADLRPGEFGPERLFNFRVARMAAGVGSGISRRKWGAPDNRRTEQQREEDKVPGSHADVVGDSAGNSPLILLHSAIDCASARVATPKSSSKNGEASTPG